MKLFATAVLTGLLTLAATTDVQAGQVTVKGVHLCCGACVNGVMKALKDVEGVSDVTADRDSKTVVFQAADDKAAERGIQALADGGFHGKVAHGDKELEFPASGIKKGQKADSVTFNGVHLCCGACVTGAQKAVAEVKGVETIDIDRGAKTVTLKGKDIDLEEAVAALNKGGFHGTVK